jgi:long-chain acyl-CoA synthetase
MLAESAEPNILQQFYASLAETGEQPLHNRKRGDTLTRVSRRQAASEISFSIRALYAQGVSPETRIAFQAQSSYLFWTAEWAAMACHCVPVVIPENFGIEDLISILAESKSMLVFVDTIATAQGLAQATAGLPELKKVICFDSKVEKNAALPILSWEEFIESGAEIADRSGATIRSINGKSTAILFYDKDGKGALHVTRYTHDNLQKHTKTIDELLGNSATIHKGETVLTLTASGHAIGHIASCYIPVLKQAIIHIATDFDSTAFECRPHIIIGSGLDLDSLRQKIIEHVKMQGPGANKELEMALALGKIKYELGKLNPWQRFAYTLLRQTIFKEVREFLGGRLRLFIGIDDAVRYETQLFFEAFGVELVELPPEILKS